MKSSCNRGLHLVQKVRYEEHQRFGLSKLNVGTITLGDMSVILLLSSNQSMSCWFSVFWINFSLLHVVSWAFFCCFVTWL